MPHFDFKSKHSYFLLWEFGFASHIRNKNKHSLWWQQLFNCNVVHCKAATVCKSFCMWESEPELTFSLLHAVAESRIIPARPDSRFAVLQTILIESSSWFRVICFSTGSAFFLTAAAVSTQAANTSADVNWDKLKITMAEQFTVKDSLMKSSSFCYRALLSDKLCSSCGFFIYESHTKHFFCSRGSLL